MSKVLIIESDAALAKILEEKLGHEGYDVVSATDGERGLALLKEKPDVVLLDILLAPKGGFDTLEAIHNDPALLAIPVVIISNTGQTVEIDRARSLGVKDFLVKANFTPQEVIDKLLPFCPPHGPTAALENRDTPPSAPQLGDQKGLILVVEDDAFLRRLLSEKLQHEGFEVGQTSGGKEALAFVKTKLPALVLLDILMPGMDGFQVLEELRQITETKNIPVIILSNLGAPDHIDHAHKLGADDYLIKAHFTLDEIVEKASAIIAKRYL